MSYYEFWVFEDGLVKEGLYNVECGVGVCVVSGEKIGFLYLDVINFEVLNKVVIVVCSIVNVGENKMI